jgi:D-alanyl-lipoteichoic acid acyltransferase DltB (MBOAT superfamily)
MLFNSYFFILVFLPVTLLVFFALGRNGGRRAAIAWLVAASLFFYGWWNPAYLGLIVASILFNYAVGSVLGDTRRRAPMRKAALVLGISANLAVLAYYKYANFFLGSLNTALGTGYGLSEIILPLEISFFTFTQIAFLVDAYRGEAREYNFFIHSCRPFTCTSSISSVCRQKRGGCTTFAIRCCCCCCWASLPLPSISGSNPSGATENTLRETQVRSTSPP